LNLKTKHISLEAGSKPIVILNNDDAEELGVLSQGRVKVSYRQKELTALVNTTTTFLQKGEIGLFDKVWNFFEIKEESIVDVESTHFPRSTSFIKNRLKGRRLNADEVREIIQDVVRGNLSEVEITAFVIALEYYGLNLEEAAAISNAMVEIGDTLQLNRKIVADKHSIGGAPGDKTSLLTVPIVASQGIAIPKSASRAITSAAGTADRAEVLMNVNLNVCEMAEIVKKTDGCLVWGGALQLAPADDILIQVEYPLSIDPLLLPSIMSKKKAVGANRLVVDIPLGRGTKVKTLSDADMLAKDFIELGSRLGIKTRCTLTYGEQPIGYAIGPALEAREALEVLSRKKHVPDLFDKVVNVAGTLLDLCGFADGHERAAHAITSGRAESKMREIIALQGGDPKIKPEDIPVGKYTADIAAKENGYVKWIVNSDLVMIARTAGSPKDKGAGLLLHKKLNDKVKKGETLLTIYADNASKLQRAERMFEETAIAVREKMEMLLKEVKEVPMPEKTFILER